MGNRGKLDSIQVLQLMEAIRLGAKQIALAGTERRLARLDLCAYPHLGGMSGRERSVRCLLARPATRRRFCLAITSSS